MNIKEQLNITSELNTFTNYKVPPGSKEAKQLFTELAGGPAWFMLLCYGKPGNGKTHLCDSFVLELYRQGKLARVRQWPEVIRQLKTAINSPDRTEYDRIINAMLETKYLILDDVGAGTTGSSWEWGILEEIISYRYRRELLTIVTTNLNIDDLPERVISRFKDKLTSRRVLNKAPDYRINRGC